MQEFLTVIVIYIEMKYILLDSKSTIIIIISNTVNSGSLTIKSILIIFYLVFILYINHAWQSSIDSRCNLLKDRC